MKNNAFLKLLKKTSPNSNSNSGFTLMELLVGLFMSIFVVGALGFGMLQVLRITQSETSKSSARNETSRAIDFISDEIRRAKKIENVATSATGFNTTNKTVVLALDIPNLPGTGNRIVYYLQSTNLGAWQGPQVLYRWGPPLDSNGEYTTGTWQYEALIDKINNTVVSSPCTTGTVTPASPTGFYACITGTNTAQLYFTGLTKTVTGSADDNYAANTQTVARVSDAPTNNSEDFVNYNWSVKDLGGAYNCNGTTEWTIRTDFDNTVNATTWIRNTNRQPQPISIDSTNSLTITTSPIGKIGCTSRGNDYLIDPLTGVDANPQIATSTTGKQGSTWENLNQYDIKISHQINFSDPRTFNGDEVSGGTNYNNPIVQADNSPTVQFLKNGSPVPPYGGLDVDGGGIVISATSPDQPSLGKFLYDKGLAVLDPTSPTTDTTLPNAKFLITSDLSKLGKDERIIAFEVGQTTTTNPGFDLQDNIFLVKSDIFKKTFSSACFSGSCPTSP